MQITISQDQYKKLLHLVYLGNWLLNSYRGEERLEEYDKAAEEMMAHAPAAGLKDQVEFDEFEGRYYPSRKLDEEMRSYWQEYDEDVFWNMLIDGLAERDFGRKYSEENLDTMEWEEYEKKIEPFLKKYEKEVDEHGLERLEVRLVS
jgi:hypothetical protein